MFRLFLLLFKLYVAPFRFLIILQFILASYL